MDRGRELFSVILPPAVGARGFLRGASLKWNPVPVHFRHFHFTGKGTGGADKSEFFLNPRALTIALTIELPHHYP